MISYNIFNRDDLQIYRRLLKYSPFLLKRHEGPMKVEHTLENGAVVRAVAPQAVTVEDAEKLFTLIYLIQTKGLPTTIMMHGNIKVIATTCNIKDIAKVLNTHNYPSIIDALGRVKELTLHFPILEKHQHLDTSLLHENIYDAKNGQIEILLNFNFYVSCINKGLHINLQRYLSLSPTTKNLYAYLCSNPSLKFKEELLFERTGINSGRTADKRASLKKGLNELVKLKYIFSYKISGGFVYLKRPRKEGDKCNYQSRLKS